MLYLFLVGFVLANANVLKADEERQTAVVLKNAEFNFPFVNDEDISYKNGVSTLYVAFSQRCVESFSVNGNFKPNSMITVSKVNGADSSGFLWTSVGEVEYTSGVATITFEAPQCSSHWLFKVDSDSKVSPWRDISLLGIRQTKKRVVTCETPGKYDADCASASEGALCINLVCGCKTSLDCFGNTDFPHCLPDSTCDRCTNVSRYNNVTNPFASHYFCETRYPGRVLHPDTNASIASEYVAPSNFYREVCVTSPPEASGSCQRCNQAPLQPQYQFSTPGSNQGASGTFHCNMIRGADGLPICMDQTYFADSGADAFYDRNRRGACSPCFNNMLCYRALPSTPTCNISSGHCIACGSNTNCEGTLGANCQADGTCQSCKSYVDCGPKDGGLQPNEIICDTQTGICRSCIANDDCSATVGGNNCQANGLCQTCTTNADCGINDGGEVKNQTICYLPTGRCIDACTANANCSSAIGGYNCQIDGTCLNCTSDADCGEKDGGERKNETTCDVKTHICVPEFKCTVNANCTADEFPGNCQADGRCVPCVGTETCGPLDGGEVPGEPNCDIQAGICVPGCSTNSDCVGTQGANCGADQVCYSCQSNADCGARDGGQIPGQGTCNKATGICGPCTSNSDCDQPGLPNCGSDGFCFNCTGGITNCTADGPPFSKVQHNCDSHTGICVDGCTQDSHCTDDCYPRCNLDTFCCVECLEHRDCPFPIWRGHAANRTTCSPSLKKCIEGCLIDGDCPTEALPACSTSNGKCVECQVDAHCGGDRPACLPSSICGTCLNDKHCASLGGPPACSSSEGKCVTCLFDSHCSSPLSVCNSGNQTCVQCLYDFHCGSDDRCEEWKCTAGKRGAFSTGAIVGIVLACVIVFAMLVAIIILSIAVRKRFAYESQPLMS